jgi:NitT/TauT family transport system substrate-binding protein
MKRSAFVVGSTTALALRPRRSSAQTLTPVVVASAPNDDLIGTLWGIETGAFRKVGLDVSLQKSNNGTAVAAAVAGGAVDIGKSSLNSLFAGRAKGFNFILVAPAGIYTADGPTSGLIALPDSPIKTGKDCTGKIMGVGALNDLTALGTMCWVDGTGGDSRTLRFVELPSSAMAAAVIAGRVDAGIVVDPQLGEALAGGKVRLVAYCNNWIAHRFLQAGYFATADYIAKNRQTVDAFRRVVNDAGAYANAHRDQMVPVIAKFTGVEPQAILAQPQQIVATSLDVKLIQPLVDAAVKYKAVPAGFDTRALVGG